MNPAEWLKKHEYDDASRELMVEAARIAEEARASGDFALAIGAKGVEMRVARMLSQQQHCVVAGAEVLEAWPAFAKAGAKDDELVERRVVWGMKYAAGSAMDLPEIPLATVDSLIAALGEMLAFWGRKPYALWLLEARRAYIAGEREKLAPYMEKVPPTINRATHFYEHTDCPGCAVQQLAEFLGPDAKPDEVEAILAPVLEPGRSFPNEPEEKRMILDLLFGDDPACDHAKVRAPAHFARVLAKAGQWQRAVPMARRAETAAEGCNEEQKLRAWLGSLEIARASKNAGDVERLWAQMRPVLDKLEDPYEVLDGILAGHAALRVLTPPPAELATLAERARAIAKRLDTRLASPHHAADTEKRLG
jgi:hypothetical protein